MLNFHGSPFTVIGIMPREMDSPHGTDAWFSVMRRSANPGWQNRANHPGFFGWGRLKEGVTVDPKNSDIVWLGTGEPSSRNSVGWGNGVYKSTDGGVTWQHMGLEPTKYISRIVIDLTAADVIHKRFSAMAFFADNGRYSGSLTRDDLAGEIDLTHSD